MVGSWRQDDLTCTSVALEPPRPLLRHLCVHPSHIHCAAGTIPRGVSSHRALLSGEGCRGTARLGSTARSLPSQGSLWPVGELPQRTSAASNMQLLQQRSACTATRRQVTESAMCCNAYAPSVRLWTKRPTLAGITYGKLGSTLILFSPCRKHMRSVSRRVTR